MTTTEICFSKEELQKLRLAMQQFKDLCDSIDGYYSHVDCENLLEALKIVNEKQV